jgi:hypothetical protein
MSNNNPFPSTMLDEDFVVEMTEEGNINNCYTPPREYCGYTLICGQLVPETFIQAVAEQIEDDIFDYGDVLGEEDIFKQEFLDALDKKSRAVLMPVVLQLVARDKFPLNLWNLIDKKEAA